MLRDGLNLMEAKLVSVIMPAYNGENYIVKAVESVIAQTYENWELIVVDDGSTDQTAFLVKAFNDPRIKYVYQENRGQAAALNHGLSIAKGDYITTLDTDDWFTIDSLSARVQFLDQQPEFGVVYGDGIYCDVDGKPLMRFSENRVGDVMGDVYNVLINTPFFGTGGNVMVRREIFETYHIRYDESIVWCQDYDIYIRIAERTAFGVIDVVTIWYRLHEANMTMSMSRERRLESYIRMKQKVLSSPRFLEVPISSRVEFFYYQFLIHGRVGQLDEQMALAKSEHFCALPKQKQAQLLRGAANHYISSGEHVGFSRVLLRTAWALQPVNPKTSLVLILSYLHPHVAKWIVNHWQDRKGERNGHHPLLRILRTM
jgi:glycosyltransferase involved in cell wall biosynthesis